MAVEDSLKRIEERLTRLESALAQQPSGGPGGFTAPGGAVVDSAPYAGGGGWVFHRPRPVVDPAPWWSGGYGHPHWPHPIVDPVPWPHPIVDPGPVGGEIPGGIGQSRTAATAFARFGPIADPPPTDISRFSIPQLESSLHSINAEKARLTSMEGMIKQQLEKLKKQG